MALPNKAYPPFLGMTVEPQGYDCALHGEPLYHCVFPADESLSSQELVDAVTTYRQSMRMPPAMSLVFRGRGTVCTDDFLHYDGSGYDALRQEIEFVMNLPGMTGDIELARWGETRSFMGKAAMRPCAMREIIVIYDIDTRLPGRQIAEEALLHFNHLREDRNIDKLVLRFPSGGSVMVNRYVGEEWGLPSLSTAIQRARKMELPDEIATVPA